MSQKLKLNRHEFVVGDEKDSIGLVDGGHTILECSSCGRPLIDIFHTQPDAIDPRTKKKFEWKIQAKCCFCGDSSYIKDITGKFHIAGYGIPKDGDPNDVTPITNRGNMYEQGELLIVESEKP